MTFASSKPESLSLPAHQPWTGIDCNYSEDIHQSYMCLIWQDANQTHAINRHIGKRLSLSVLLS